MSDYERGRRAPALETLDWLVAAAEQTLDITLAPATPGQMVRLAERLLRHRDRIVELATARGVTNLRLFGSVARGDDAPGSDVDLLVDLAPGTGLFALLALGDELGDLLGASVDVVPADSLKPRFAAAVLADAVPV